MMKINPNNFSMRELSNMPPYFTKFKMDRVCVDHEKKNIASWIYQNCTGKFAIMDDVKFSKNNQVKRVTSVGFEIDSELTLFILSGTVQKDYSA